MHDLSAAFLQWTLGLTEKENNRLMIHIKTDVVSDVLIDL